MCELGDSELLAKGGVQVFKTWVFLVLCASLSNLFFINTLQNLLGLGDVGSQQGEGRFKMSEPMSYSWPTI